MNPKLVSISSTSHNKMWKPVDVTPKMGVAQAEEGFIFSTAADDENPQVVFEFSNDYLTRSKTVLIRNRIGGGRSVAERVIGLVVEASIDSIDWRPLNAVLTEAFIYGGESLKIALKGRERFLRFSRSGGRSHFHLGAIEAPIEDWPDYALEMEFKAFVRIFGRASNSQRLQDVFALFVNGFGPNYFVEFGVADGTTLSNTLLLEVVGWHGVCGEALDSFFTEAAKRRHCTLVNHALAAKTGENLEFRVSGLLSSLSKTASKDIHSEERERAACVSVVTKRLDEILDDAGAPSTIGFLSLDIEGAELEVLSSFSFSKYKFCCAVIEHNHSPDELAIDQIMISNGYVRVLKAFSGHDAFYIHNSHSRFPWTESGLKYLRPHPTGQQLVDGFGFQ